MVGGYAAIGLGRKSRYKPITGFGKSTVKAANLTLALVDIGGGLMAWTNIIGILIIFVMRRPALKALKDYDVQKVRGAESYIFDLLALGIKNSKFWESYVADKNSSD